MRKILFKAKRIDNGEWVFGYVVDDYLGQSDRVYIVGRSTVTAQVKPETISQYTGLKDKNGKMIFENDIMNKYKINQVVEFSTNLIANCGCCYQVYAYGYDFSDIGSVEELEIIGNRFDNPELLGE